MATMPRFTDVGRSTSLPPEPRQTDLSIQATIQPVSERLQHAAEAVQHWQFANLNLQTKISKLSSQLTSVTEERDIVTKAVAASVKALNTAEDKLRSAEERAKEDRAQWVELKNMLSNGKRKAEEGLQKGKDKIIKLSAKIKCLEDERLDIDRAHKAALELAIDNTQLKEDFEASESANTQLLLDLEKVKQDLETSESAKEQLLQSLEQLRSQIGMIQQHNASFFTSNNTLSTTITKLEAEIDDIKRQNTQCNKEIQLLSHTISCRDSTNQKLRGKLAQVSQLAHLAANEEGPPLKRGRTDQGYSAQPDATYSVQMPNNQSQHGLPSPGTYGTPRHQSFPPSNVRYHLLLVIESRPELITSSVQIVVSSKADSNRSSLPVSERWPLPIMLL